MVLKKLGAKKLDTSKVIQDSNILAKTIKRNSDFFAEIIRKYFNEHCKVHINQEL